MNSPKKIAAIHDIAGFGRSSLTVVIPVMSVMGHQACPVPTAVLSTITGFYNNVEMFDLTSFLPSYLDHWKREGFAIDCVYSGFLGSVMQSKIAGDFIRSLSAPLVVVDPVFADDGKLYSCFDRTMVAAMKDLIKKADVITPNVTEAAFLLSEDTLPQNCEQAKDYAKRLCQLGPKSVIITSVPDNKNIAALIYSSIDGRCRKIANPYVHAHYPGTGDLFTSVLTGALVKGMSLDESAAVAADFVFMSIKTAYENKVPVKEGVPLEAMLPRLYENHALTVEDL